MLLLLQECFAVRADVDGMLDVARHTFLQSTDDIYQIADEMTQEAGYHVKVCPSAIRALGGGGNFVIIVYMHEDTSTPPSMSAPFILLLPCRGLES